MGKTISIADIYYQIQETWQSIASDGNWKFAIWVASFSNVDIVDKFLEVERSPLGSCEDIFFRFSSEYDGDRALYIRQLWDEYCSWFTEEIPESFDMLGALQKDGAVNWNYLPTETDNPTLEHLWTEFLLLKSSIKGLEDKCFCIYFPPTLPDGIELTEWFSFVLGKRIPNGIRLVTIDYAEKRKVRLSSSSTVKLLKAEFDMCLAIKNEMDRECGAYSETEFDSRYRRQLRRVLDCTTECKKSILDDEVRKFFALVNKDAALSVHISTFLIASQAYYYIKEFKQSMTYVDETIYLAGNAMTNHIADGYPLWKVAMFLKAAIYAIGEDRDKAIEIYEQVADVASDNQDAFYVMESYRMSGYLLYEQNKKERAFQCFLLSLAGGSYLHEKIRRESTFLYSASLALQIGKDVRSPKEIQMLESQLKEWLGNDWRELIECDDMKNARKRRRASIFS